MEEYRMALVSLPAMYINEYKGTAFHMGPRN
jgi:hypothetical protein